MASRRWVITTPPPRTAVCPRCRQKRNQLAVYPAFEGKACYSCLTNSLVAERAAATVPAPAIAEPVAVPLTMSTRLTTCSEAGCGRLPAHKGEHRATLLRRPKPAAVTFTYGG
jgi:hypothetical protein